jgi:hypothetical protein
MKRLLYFLLIFPFFINAQAPCHVQESGGATPSEVPEDKAGTSFQVATYSSSNSKIKGSPYAFSDWSSGEIATTSKSSIKYEKIQFDLERNQVLVYSKGSQVPTRFPTNEIISLKANDSKNIRNFTTVNSEEFVDGNEGKLYEVLSSNNDLLIKETTKYVSESNASSQDDTKKMIYKKRTAYFIKDKTGKYVKTKLSKKHILKLLKDKEKDIKTYISKNKLSFNEKGVSKIIEYYHSLS